MEQSSYLPKRRKISPEETKRPPHPGPMSSFPMAADPAGPDLLCRIPSDHPSTCDLMGAPSGMSQDMGGLVSTPSQPFSMYTRYPNATQMYYDMQQSAFSPTSTQLMLPPSQSTGQMPSLPPPRTDSV